MPVDEDEVDVYNISIAQDYLTRWQILQTISDLDDDDDYLDNDDDYLDDNDDENDDGDGNNHD